MSKITTRRLRDYPWNVRLGAILAASALIVGSVVISAEAQARSYLSIARAQAAIQKTVQVDHPSRVALSSCLRNSRVAVTCEVEETAPHGVFVIEWEAEPEETANVMTTTFSDTATLMHHGIVVS